MESRPPVHPVVEALQAGLTGGLVSLVAWRAGAAVMIPPLGATIYLSVTAPRAASSSPRNALLGHAVAFACGWLALAVSGVLGQPSALVTGCQPGHAAAVALALVGTIAITRWLDAGHPPAGATTVVVALGLLQKPSQFLAAEAGAVLCVGCAYLMHRRRGAGHYPFWRHAEPG